MASHLNTAKFAPPENRVLEPANDNFPQAGVRSENLLARAFVIFAATSLLGCVLLAAEISVIAGLFGVPEFAQQPRMEWLMAGALGIGAACCFLFKSLRRP